MEINVRNIKNKLINITKLIENYDIIILNLDNQYNQIASYWKDNNAINFLEITEEHSKKVKNMYLELTSLKELYEKLIEEYEKIGNKININLDEKDNILTFIKDYITKIENLIKSYEAININILEENAYQITNQKNKLISIKEELTKYKDNIKLIFESILKIEENINNLHSKITIELLKEISFNVTGGN